MYKIAFDNDRYVTMQSEKIAERIGQFDNKLYLEFGGKLFDDFHASRVLPGFQPDSKIRMLQQLKDMAEIVIAINANDIEKSKVRSDLGITYDQDVTRLIDAFRNCGLLVSYVVITQYAQQPSAMAFREKLTKLGIRTALHYPIAGYPANTSRSSPTKDTARMNTCRRHGRWSSSRRRAPAAASWRSASRSCTRNRSAASRPAMPSSRPSRSGTCPCSIR
jgi:uncharacterized protein (UPF0371 family)